MTAAICALVLAVASGASQRYLEYKAAVDKSSSIDDLVPFMTAERARFTAQAPPSTQEQAWGSLKSVSGLLSRVTVVKETVQGDTARLQVRAIDAPGGGKPTSGTVDMVREDGQWKVRQETWTIGAMKDAVLIPGVTEAVQSAPSEPDSTAPAQEAPDPAAAAIGDVRTVISAEAAYQSANQGYYDTLQCLAGPSACIPGYARSAPTFIEADFVSPGVRNGYRRRFDAGAPAPARNVGPGKASRSSLMSYAYWAIPDPAAPGLHAICGDGGGIVCEMAGATAPPTRGECPVKRGCRPVQ